MSRKTAAYERLTRMTAAADVLPTTRLDRASDSLSDLADAIGAGYMEETFASYAQPLSFLGADAMAAPAYELIEAEPLREQIAQFTRAGLLFFRASPALLDRPLTERRTVGGSGSITRVMVAEDRLLLETPRVIVQFDENIDDALRAELIERHGLIVLQELRFMPGGVRAALLGGNATDVSLQLMEHDAVQFAEPDFVEHVGERLRPSDPLYSRQWHLHNDGRNGAVAGADISAEGAWAVSSGAGARIVVVDNGFEVGHNDLSFGPLSGWFRQTADFVDADFVRGTAGMPSNDHGTACAGMAAARSNNGTGGCGVAWAAESSMIACLGDQVGTQSTLARALAQAARPHLETNDDIAADTGADVICCSLGPNGAAWPISQTLRAAIEFVATEGRRGTGTPLFWACTNGNYPISSDEVCSQPSVIAVGRSTSADDEDGSGFGPKLEFLAPGVDVLIPAEGNAHQITTGTSFAAPCAAGIAALMLSKNPARTAADVRQILRDTCDKVGTLPYAQGRNNRFGFGRVNAEKAVAAA